MSLNRGLIINPFIYNSFERFHVLELSSFLLIGLNNKYLGYPI